MNKTKEGFPIAEEFSCSVYAQPPEGKHSNFSPDRKNKIVPFSVNLHISDAINFGTSAESFFFFPSVNLECSANGPR